jgi:RNA exonuclease 4
MVRDTQKCKILRERAKNKRPGLKKLAEMELGLEIQKGSHSSVSVLPLH